MIGQTISHYKILEKLGEGGMGVVYKAHDTELDRDIALKFLPHYLTSDEAERERFYHEARAASALNHPNITTIYEIGQTGEQLFLAMEYVDGKTLKKLIERESFPVSRVLEIAIQICDGLAAAAEKVVVHRDIKSDNIMVTSKGQVKIMDFGLAKLKGASRLTKAGSTLGTAAYMSPEQAQGVEVDPRSDIFSFGVVLYELLTGRLPFQGEHHAALMYSLINEDPPPIARFNDKVTPEIERIVSKALSKDRGERYQHIDELLADLRRERKQLEYAKTGYVRASTVSVPTTGLPFKAKLVKYSLAIVGVVVLVILGLIFNPFNLEVSMQKSTALEKNSLAVIYFENIPDPEDKDHTGEMLSNLLITSLSQARDLEVISRERLQDIQNELGQGDAKAISSSLATQVAKKAGVTTMLLGSVLQKDPKLAVTTRLIDVQSGKIINSQRLTNFSSQQIFTLVDSLALLIRNDLSITPASTTDTKSIAEVTTKSPEAYRSYVEGVELYRKFYLFEGKAAMERALELDKEFAMAYFYLAELQARLGNDGTSRAMLQKAVEFSARTTERERLQILTASYLSNNELSKAVETSERMIERYPRELFSYLQLARAYVRLLNGEMWLETYRRGVRVDPTNKSLWNSIAYVSANLGRKQEALEASAEQLKLAPGEPNPYDTRGDIYAKFGQYDSSRVWYSKALSFRRDFDSATKLGFDAIIRQDYTAAEQYLQITGIKFPAIDIARGHLKSAERSIPKTPTIQMALGSAGAVFRSLALLIHFSYDAGDYQEMLRRSKELVSQLSKNPSDKIYGRDYLAWALVKNGDSPQSKKMLGEIQRELDTRLPFLQVSVDYASALVAFEEGNYKVAVNEFRKTYGAIFPNHDPNLFFAISMLKNGDAGEAVKELERLTRWYPIVGGFVTLLNSPGSAQYWPVSSIKAHYWLGVAYEQQGERQNAINEYETFLDIWKDADTITKEMQDAKARVAKLKGISGG